MSWLCWFIPHSFKLNRVIRDDGYGQLKGHSCVRCGAIPPEQRGIG